MTNIKFTILFLSIFIFPISMFSYTEIDAVSKIQDYTATNNKETIQNTLSSNKKISSDTKQSWSKKIGIVASVILLILIIVNIIMKIKMNSYLKIKKSLKQQNKFIHFLINSQHQIIIMEKKSQLYDVNKAFLEFFRVSSIDEFIGKHQTSTISTMFNKNSTEKYLDKFIDNKSWIDYVIDNPDKTHKVEMTSSNNNKQIFSVSALNIKNSNFKSASFTNITHIEMAKKELNQAHLKMKQSLKYAFDIQKILASSEKELKSAFEDSFLIWKPRDFVGGDIYLHSTLRNKNEHLILLVDCTGHGISGAFMTMLVVATKELIVAEIKHNKNLDVDVGKTFEFLNITLKKLLRQEDENAVTNIGFDGAMIYYNQNTNILKYTGAKMPLYQQNPDENLQIIKSNRDSIGYKTTKIDVVYKEHIIKVESGMKFYLTTDGYIDQLGGPHDFPFGKRKFKEIITDKNNHTMQVKKEKLMYAVDEHKNFHQDESQTDDITIIGFTIN